MRKVLSTMLCIMLALSAFGQSFNQKSLKNILLSAQSNTYVVVVGYYVDNSSFMVTNSSDIAIATNTRYPVYEYKYQLTPHSQSQNNMVESPVFTKKNMQGENHPRILFLNKKQTSKSQLVVDESAVEGMPIVGEMAKFVQSPDQIVYMTSLDALHDFLFNKGAMPEIIEEEISSQN